MKVTMTTIESEVVNSGPQKSLSHFSSAAAVEKQSVVKRVIKNRFIRSGSEDLLRKKIFFLVWRFESLLPTSGEDTSNSKQYEVLDLEVLKSLKLGRRRKKTHDTKRLFIAHYT